MSEQLERARLIPITSGEGEEVETDERNEILLDFNPESLAIRASSGQQFDRGKRSQQRVEFTARSTTTLSFDAIFDNTRPQAGGVSQQGQELDVRLKTVRIFNLLQADRRNGQLSPQRVRFH